MRVSKRASAITEAAGTAWELSDLAARLARTNPDIIQLTVGDVDQDTPASVIETAIASLRAGRTHYAPIAGDPDFRAAVARSCSARLNREITRDQVVIFPGAQCALFSVVQCVADVGDEVMLLEPSYATYEAVVAASGAVPVRVSLRNRAGFSLDVDRIAQALSPHCRAVLVNSPNNPSGAVFAAEALAQLVELCAQRGVWLISDEVYARLTFDKAHVSPASLPGGADCVVLVDSLSKSHAMTGWRIGWALAPQRLASHLIDLAQAELFSSPPFIQDAAVAALQHEGGMAEVIRTAYRRRRDLFLAELDGCPGVHAFIPEGGMFVLVDISALGMSSPQFARELLEQEKVAVIAGVAFGASVADTARIGLTQPEDRLREAARRLRRFATSRWR